MGSAHLNTQLSPTSQPSGRVSGDLSSWHDSDSGFDHKEMDAVFTLPSLGLWQTSARFKETDRALHWLVTISTVAPIESPDKDNAPDIRAGGASGEGNFQVPPGEKN